MYVSRRSKVNHRQYQYFYGVSTMSSSTNNYPSVSTESTFSRKVRVFFNEISYVLGLTGRAYLHGVRPL
jgi:hypothetical protein